MTPRFYLTTAIDYANGDPHLGHAYEKLGADAIARYRRIRGDDVWFLIGMDEHGQKVAQAAADRGTTPQALADDVAIRFQQMWRRLGVTYDQFIRTTSAAHHEGVRTFIERILERNPDDFYERAYAGWYCVGCEAFKSDAEITDERCMLHPTRQLEWVEERNWFFRLSRYTDFLLEYHEQHPEFLQPASRRNEILSFLRQGLDDISASRSRFSWGVPFPRPTSSGETQTTYVWFDALPNYWTATRETDSRGHWPAQLHVIGKDITRFHAIIWPAMLRAAELPLPERVWAHGFVLYRGERFSKSAGQTLDLMDAIERFGPDSFRYFLLREIPWDADGTFSWERFEERYTSDLADGLGNLVSRSIAMLDKYRQSRVPEAGAGALDTAGADAVQAYAAAMDKLDLRAGADAAWALVTAANGYIQERAPWVLAKAGDSAALDDVLGALARVLQRLSVLAHPFLPVKAEALRAALGLTDSPTWAEALSPSLTGASVVRPPALFPKPEPLS